MAVSYSGKWPVTATTKQHGSANYCLTLIDNGSLGYPHSGQASLARLVAGNPLYATFQVIDHTMLVTTEVQGGTGQNAGLVFTPHASNRNIGKGVYEEVYGGENFTSGTVVFGSKGGC